MIRPIVFFTLLGGVASSCTTTSQARPPVTTAGAVQQDFFGTSVADPYRWLEDANAPETKAWVAEQNSYTFKHLQELPERQAWTDRLTQVINAERYTGVLVRNNLVLYAHDTGLQNQPIWYKSRSLQEKGRPILDPNAWDPAGGLSIPWLSLAANARLLAYGVSKGGSDWTTVRVQDLQTGQTLTDTVEWVKFSRVIWSRDNQGFYYSRFPEPQSGQSLSAANVDNRIYYHRLGTPQADDTLVFQMKDEPGTMHFLGDTEDFLVISSSARGSQNRRIFIKSLHRLDSPIVPIFTRNDAIYKVVSNQKQDLFVMTDKDAPRYRLVRVSTKATDPALHTVIPEPEGRDTMIEVEQHRDKFLVTVRHDVMTQLHRYDSQGKQRETIELPPMGGLDLLHAASDDRQEQTFALFSSYLEPATILSVNAKEKKAVPVWQTRYAYDPQQFTAKQVFYTSKDGTKIPMTILAKKDRIEGTAAPTLLWGYGGFNVSVEPRFASYTIPWLERGGVYAIANLRGGGEYGKDWYEAGRLFKKQNVFDDFIAAAEYLIREKYTNAQQLGIEGRSNGGLLVGAAMTQRPELFKAALPTVGVLDMLRFHLFTVGAGWTGDYLIPDEPNKFASVIKYSPLHNVKAGGRYPATLILTGDHDDRVVPAHSYKFAAALQAANAGPNPVYIRIETDVGHGAGAPLRKRIEERADVLSFMGHELGFD